MLRFSPDKSGADLIDVSLDGEFPFCALSFDYQHGHIPIPGLAGMFSDSVTGMLEGLRLVSRRGHPGKINFGYFVGPGRIRSLSREQWCTGYSYRGRCVDLVEARRLVLIPAYLWVLSHAPKAVVALTKLQKRSRFGDLWLYDGNDSGRIDAPERLSAAALLVAYLTGQLVRFQEGWSVFEQ